MDVRITPAAGASGGEGPEPLDGESSREGEHYGLDLDIVRRGLLRQNRTTEQAKFAIAALDRLAGYVAELTRRCDETTKAIQEWHNLWDVNRKETAKAIQEWHNLWDVNRKETAALRRRLSEVEDAEYDFNVEMAQRGITARGGIPLWKRAVEEIDYLDKRRIEAESALAAARLASDAGGRGEEERGIVAELAASDPETLDSYEEATCHYCRCGAKWVGGDDDNLGRRELQHADGCLWLRARRASRSLEGSHE